MHRRGFRAAEAAEAAGAQGQFWAMHDMLFEHQHALEDADLLSYADYLGLDLPRFVAELADGTHEVKVRSDFMSGVRSGVNGTPSFFINGIRHDGPWDVDSLTEACLAAVAVHV
jgi:protein-disulfide isomerase